MGRQDKASGKKKTTLGREGIVKINSRELSILKNQQFLHYVSINLLQSDTTQSFHRAIVFSFKPVGNNVNRIFSMPSSFFKMSTVNVIYHS